MVNQFLQSLITHWDETLVFLTESVPSNHTFLPDAPFFRKYAVTFSKFAATPANTHQLIESFLELLPYPEKVNEQSRNVHLDDSWYSSLKAAINDKHRSASSQSLDESVPPIVAAVVGKMVMVILRFGIILFLSMTLSVCCLFLIDKPYRLSGHLMCFCISQKRIPRRRGRI